MVIYSSRPRPKDLLEHQRTSGVNLRSNSGILIPYKETGLRTFSSSVVPPIPYSYEDLKLNPVDWAKSGTIGPIRDQRDVGTCYACTSACVMSHAIYRRTGIYRPISAQWFVDFAYFCDGIHGGYQTLEFARTYGAPFEDEYPYEEVALVSAEEHAKQKLERVTRAMSQGKLEFGTIQCSYKVDPDEEMVLKSLKSVGPLYFGLQEFGKYLVHHPEIISPSTPGIAETALNGNPGVGHAMMAYAYGVDSIMGQAYIGFKNSHGYGEMVRVETRRHNPLFHMFNYVYGVM